MVESERKLIETIDVKFNEDDRVQCSGAVMGPWCELEAGNNGRMGAVDNSPNFCPEPKPVDTDSAEDDVPVQQTADGSIDTGVRTFDGSPKKVSWFRKPKRRADGSPTDIYYYEDGCNKRLRSIREAKEYCDQNNILYKPELFDFSASNKYKGIVGSAPATSHTSS